MRNLSLACTLLALALAPIAACANAAPETPDALVPPPTLRAQLAEPVRLAIDPLTATGAITASEHEGADWLPAQVSLAIAEGSFQLETADDALVLHALEVDIAPVALPMLPGNAQLTDIALRLPAPAEIGVTWQDDDDAIAVATLDLDLVWSFSASGGTLPLGTQRLAAVPIAIAMHGAQGVTQAQMGIDQPGQLWSWADLVALADLALVLPAQSAPAPAPFD